MGSSVLEKKKMHYPPPGVREDVAPPELNYELN